MLVVTLTIMLIIAIIVLRIGFILTNTKTVNLFNGFIKINNMAKLGYFFRIKDLQIFLNCSYSTAFRQYHYLLDLFGKEKRLTVQDVTKYYGVTLQELENFLL